MSPTILTLGPYRFYFYSGDFVEPPHVHVQREQYVAKFWLNPVRLQSSGGFRPVEIRKIQRLIEQRESELLESWYDYFGN